MDKTEFCDRSGKPLHVGDIVQYRLGKFAKKSGGPSLFRIIRTKKGVGLGDPHADSGAIRLMRKNYEQYITLFERANNPDITRG